MSVMASATALPAMAQVVAPGDPAPAPLEQPVTSNAARQVYDAAFFTQFAPANALQIVARVPGFSIQSADESVRGFAAAAGNVVINGQRPSSKSESLETILSRIPASRVLRVEVGAGEQFGAEYAGKAQVLNLVLTAGGGLAGTIEGAVLRDYTGKVLPEGSVSALLKTGKSTFNVAAQFNNNRTTERGYDRVTALPSGALIESREKVNRINDPNASLSASWAHDDGAFRTANLNARVAIDRFRLDQTSAVTPASGPLRDDRLSQRYQSENYEVGGDITRPLAGGGIKLIGLATQRNRRNADRSYLRVNGGTIGGFEQFLDDERSETLARLVWSRPNATGWTVELGAEGVINRLASKVDLFSLASGGAATRIDLPVDDAVVKEYRGEAFVNAGRALAKNLRLDLAATYETSRLTVTGDAQAERSLSFLKPRAVLDWRPGNKWRLQLSVQRTVAQLQFEDFISSAELTNDRVNGGNAQLLPQRAWESLLTIERPILGDGLIKLELGYNRIEKVQDRVLTPEGFDAPGNLGSGTVKIARARIDAPLAKLGIKGGRLTLYASYVGTSVVDPYTGETRRFSGNNDFLAQASFRQDLGKFAWGFSVDGSTPGSFYRLNEVDKNYSVPPYVTAFAEYRPDRRTTLTLSIDNLTATPSRRERTFYAPDRRTRTPSSFELRHRNRYLIPAISFKRSFG
ncbi:hypothetical protein BFL28_09210 [Sphingomonas turrisvirgatae]|uniref:TonB-dependent receptor-like beta-barrel domain-containing protein n=2 Tax=Sphingomonas turrisvirgatae TaxID=1888892 RepID=A0A1E3M0I4_9SPHN|nr:hypothetical protein BFL28_09210 [Sphingomonas turrisvirgatae]